MSVKIYPYKQGSRGAKALADGMGIRVLKQEGSTWKPTAKSAVINWGASTLPARFDNCLVLNKPDAVVAATDKLRLFRDVDDTSLMPRWSASREDAVGWAREGHKVMCRTVLNGHSGRGIVVSRTEDELVDAPLYVQYVKKKEEFRVHIMHGEVFDVQRKARRLEVEEPNWDIRNHDNGFIYARNDIQVPKKVTGVAVKVFKKTDLDFGAVDVIFNTKQDLALVLEINTAPGLTGTTVDNYVATFKEKLGA